MLEYHALRDREVESWKREPPANALDPAEVAQFEALISTLSRYPAKHSSEFVDVAPTHTDESVAKLCRAYRDGVDMQRAYIRSRINEVQGWILLTFSKRAAVRGIQERDVEEVRLALIANAIENLAAKDVRDNLVALGLIYYCASTINAKPGDLFEEAVQLAGPAIQAVLRDFNERNDLDDIAVAMGFEEVEDGGQIGFRWC